MSFVDCRYIDMKSLYENFKGKENIEKLQIVRPHTDIDYLFYILREVKVHKLILCENFQLEDFSSIHQYNIEKLKVESL